MVDISDELKNLASPDYLSRPRMSEKDFVRFLLPLLVNIDNQKQLDMTIWLDIAGNPHRPIDVYDAGKQLLFTVPPLLARVPTEMPTRERSGVDFNSILHLYGAKRKAEHPAAADAWFMAAIADAVISVDEQQAIEWLKSWVSIYSRYDIPLNKLFGGADVAQPASDETTKVPTPVSGGETLTGEFDDL